MCVYLPPDGVAVRLVSVCIGTYSLTAWLSAWMVCVLVVPTDRMAVHLDGVCVCVYVPTDSMAVRLDGVCIGMYPLTAWLCAWMVCVCEYVPADGVVVRLVSVCIGTY